MGKNRDSMERKLDAFEREMNEYAISRQQQGKPPVTFSLEKKMRIDMINLAREPGSSIEKIIESMRPQIQGIIDRPAFFMETGGKSTLN